MTHEPVAKRRACRRCTVAALQGIRNVGQHIARPQPNPQALQHRCPAPRACSMAYTNMVMQHGICTQKVALSSQPDRRHLDI